MEQGRNSTSASTTESDLWVKVTGRTIRRERVVGRTAKTMWRTRKKRKREEEENCDMQSPQLVKRRHLLLPRRVSSYSVKVFLLLLVALPMPHSARANSPPRFVLDGDGGDGGDIVVRLKEGPATPPGTRILRLRGFDPDGDDMQFGVLGREGAALLRVENHNNGEASVYLNRVLDAETRSEYSAVLTLTDGRLGEGNFISRSFLLLVEDVNDNPPVFLPFPQTVSVREHAGPTVVTTVEATDRDSGVFGQVVYSLEAADGDTDDFPFTVRTSGGRGVVSVVRDLDFERKSVYELRVVAKDRASLGGRENTATAALLVKVEDISDAPPEFVSAPSVTRIPEDVPRFTEVLRVRAVDGDRGVNNPVVYSLVSGPTHLFAVNADTGVVYTRSELDRESSLGGAGSSSADGAFILGVEAREVGGGSGDPSATVEVTIILEDVNDETPTFRSQSYVAEIAENSQRGTPVNFVGGGGGQAAGIPEVFDHDAGSNGTFRLFLRDDLEGMFEVTPTRGIGDTSFSLRVRNSSLLDFERLREANFTLVAREEVTEAPKESSVRVTVRVTDQNDNSPEFSKDRYEVDIPENVSPGSTVAWIRATDRDSDLLGTAGIRFTRVSGPMSEFLRLDPRTGVVSVAGSGPDSPYPTPSPFDRERSDLHHLTVEARDEGGAGNRNSVELILRVTDVNDNPPRFLRDYYESFLPENSLSFPSGPLVVRAADADQNGTDNSRLRYRIVDGSPGAANFTVDSVTGEIRPSGLVDFEAMSSPLNSENDFEDGGGSRQGRGLGEERAFLLTLRAYDMGSPPLHSEVTVAVFVTDRNDHAPVFERDMYFVQVEEDAPPGTQVARVHASDGDASSPNNAVTYRLASGARDKFTVDPDTGVVSVAPGASLDPDLAPGGQPVRSYHLELAAVDGAVGTSRLSGATAVNVTVIDVNNKSPSFVGLRAGGGGGEQIRVAEDASPGHFLTKLLAFDPDLSARLRYSVDWPSSEATDENGRSLQPGEASLDRLFELDGDSGEIRVVGELDREKVESIRLSVRVEDLNARDGPQSASAVVPIVVEDVNDNSPVFRRAFYLASLVENSAEGTPVARVAAKDVDKNKTVYYSLEGAASLGGHLLLDAESGEIFAGQNPVDCEATSWLNLTVRATDSGDPPRSSYADLSVRVLDENDNAPVFARDEIHLEVAEDAPVGAVVARVEAHDADRDREFGKVTYFLDRHSVSLGAFRIHPETGELSVFRALDREEADEYSLLVEAYDNYQFGFSTGDSRHAFAQVSVSISDVNDEAPVFEEREEDDSGCTVITEFHEMSEAVMRVRATDADDPNTGNGQVKFRILAGNELDLFRMDSSSGRIYPRRRLKGFYGNYTLTVEARDGGRPPNHSREKFSVCVQDFNDNAPRFIRPPRNFTIRVYENATLGQEIISVKAVDTDVGLNGAVRYRIRKDPLGNYKSFHVDAETGAIRLARELDRERQRVYEIRVEAFDLGVPTPLQSDLDLTIYVKNVNDHPPQFTIDAFEVEFTEHKAPGAERVLLVDTVDQDDDDYDDDEEAALSSSSSSGDRPSSSRLRRPDVCYFIVGGDSPDHLFELLPQEHELLLNREVDRESRAEYQIVVRATEECLSPPPPLEAKREEFDPADDALLLVTVRVADIDDSPPKFSKDVFTGGISTDIDFGTSFMIVSATDDDEGTNAILEYSLDGEILPSKNSEGVEDIRRPPFLVDPSTGEISLNFDPQRGMKGYFAFGVSASDAAGHVDKARVQIYLLREDQRVRFVMRDQPSQIRGRIDRFLQVLGEATDSLVNADAFLVHSSPDGTLDKTKTDVLLHFVDPRDNSVMEAPEVLRLIDYRTEELAKLFRDFNVIDTEGVTAEENRTRSASLVREEAMVLWLSGLCAFLFLLLVVVVCLHVNARRNFSRRLRAATVDAYHAGDALNKRELVPNTNRHASEGSNPIWLTGVGYENAGLDDEGGNGGGDEAVVREARNGLVGGALGVGGAAAASRRRHHHDHNDYRDEGLDSLDANVLNARNGGGRIMDDDEEEEDGDYHYATTTSQLSNGDGGGGSTIRVSSVLTASKMRGGGGHGVHDRSSSRSSSSGLGSGASRGGGFKHAPLHGGKISSIFPLPASPIDRLNGSATSGMLLGMQQQQQQHGSPPSRRGNSSRNNYGTTFYDDDDVPRTEL